MKHKEEKSCNEEILRETARVTGIPEYKVRDVISKINSIIENQISSGKFVEIKLPYLGKILPKYKKIVFNKKLKEM